MFAPPALRFAPSPNGLMHLGHAYSALFTMDWAHRLGARVLLRIEDIDTARCRPEYIAAMFEDLAWVGFAWDPPVRRQSEHFGDYRAAADALRHAGLTFPCFCTRSQIKADSDGETDPDGAPLYSGRCKGLSRAERERLIAQGTPHQWRLDMAAALARGPVPDICEAHPTPDLSPQPRPADPARWGDVVLVRKDTPTSYHLSVVVDDAIQAISHVTRGYDLYASTDIHRLLQHLLDLPSPVYCHHPLVVDDEAEKLAKSRASLGLGAMREAGWTPDDIRERFGLSPSREA